MRLVKDEFEIAQLQLAVDYTVKGFEDVVRALPAAEGRGERVIEGVFHLRARVEGNDIGYDTIAASGSNATVLHWMRNTGAVRRGDLLVARRGRRVPQPLHRRRHAHDADQREVLPGPATHLRTRARGPAGGHRRRQARRDVQGAARSGDEGPRPGSLRPRHLEGGARGGASPRATNCTGATRCTARVTCSDSTCTTAPTPATRCTATACSKRATCSPSSRVSTSRRTTSRCPRSIAASACASRTTSWSPRPDRRNLSAALPRRPRRGRGVDGRAVE